MNCDFPRFTYVTTHSPTLPLLHLHDSSFSNHSFASLTSPVEPPMLQSLIIDHSPIFPSLHLHHSSFSNPSVALLTSQLILQPFRCFTYVTAHSPTLLSLLLRHSSFSNTSFASPTSQALHLRRLGSRPCDSL